MDAPLRGGAYGIYLQGSDRSFRYNNTLKGCSIYGFGKAAVYNYESVGLKLLGCVIDSAATSNTSGVYNYKSNGTHVVGCTIRNVSVGLYFSQCNILDATSADTIRIINNMITTIKNSAISMSKTNLSTVYHNSLKPAKGSPCMSWYNTKYVDHRVANNIFYAENSTEGISISMYRALYWDHNDYHFINNSIYARFLGNAYYSLSDLKKLTSANQNSLEVDPEWNGDDLRTYVLPLNNKGIDLSSWSPYVKKDIDGKRRPNSRDGRGKVDIGPNDFYDYCLTKVDSLNNDIAIAKVKLANIENSSGLSASGYTYYKKDIVDLDRGKIHKILIERLTGSKLIEPKVWIDWNGDGYFTDKTELVLTDSATTANAWTDSFKVSATAVIGKTRMRISLTSPYSFHLACGNRNIGEVEDYVINILPDLTPPVIKLKGGSMDTMDIYTSWQDPGFEANDAVDGDLTSMVVVTNDIDTATLGEYTVTYKVVDGNGNTATVQRTVVVSDISMPMVTLIGEDTSYVHVGGTFNDLGATVSDNYDTNVKVVTSGTVNTGKVGVYKQFYCATDIFGNGPSCVERVVVVFDSIPPVITLRGNSKEQVEVFSKYEDALYDVVENDEYTVTTSGTWEGTDSVGIFTLIYTATDNSGNMSKATREITVVDAQAPIVKLIGEQIDTIMRWSKYEDPGATATDNYYPKSKITLITSGTFENTQSEGIFKVTYIATDPSGNTSDEVSRVLIIVSPTSIDEASNFETAIYPNPSNGSFFIKRSNVQADDFGIRVFDYQGKAIKPNKYFSEVTIGLAEIDLSTLVSGFYYIELISGEERVIEKVMLVR